ncbi:MAG: FAD-dependent oxidoreductase [Elusimicrobiota bacterium]|nr:FAD-dependent oxidoreductase [Elusimicrobiota bacterium]
MAKRKEILIIGGGPAAAVSAATARNHYPGKNITVIKDKDTGVIPCGIPYMVNSLDKPENNIMSFDPIEEKGVEVIIDKVEKINRDKKNVETKGGKIYSYEKLILAVGSSPVIPPIKGVELDKVFSIKKDFSYLKNMVESIKESSNIVIIGGGFIGVEFADEISKLKNKNVYLVEMLPELLGNSFDSDFSQSAVEKLKESGVNILTGSRVSEISGSGRVEKVILNGGKEINADLVLLSIGGRPNVKLADEAGLQLGLKKGIWVDEYMRTVDTDIFAIGDCAEKRDFFTRKSTPVMLASTASAEARIAGANLYELKVIRENKGTIAVYSTYVSGLVLGSAGLTETSARSENFDVAIGKAEGVDKHPGMLPGANKLKVKLVFSKRSGILMGGQVSGGHSAGELINVIGMAIQKNITINELESYQVATHPYITPAPTKYNLIVAAQDAAGDIWNN